MGDPPVFLWCGAAGYGSRCGALGQVKEEQAGPVSQVTCTNIKTTKFVTSVCHLEHSKSNKHSNPLYITPKNSTLLTKLFDVNLVVWANHLAAIYLHQTTHF